MAVSNTSSKTNHIIHLSQLFNLLQPAMAVITNRSSLTTIELFHTIQVLPCTYITTSLSIPLILILDNYWYCSLGNRIHLVHLHNCIGIHIHILNKYMPHNQELYRELPLQQLAYHQTQTSYSLSISLLQSCRYLFHIESVLRSFTLSLFNCVVL